jgi:hypothetical protein
LQEQIVRPGIAAGLEVLDGTKAQWVDWAESSFKAVPKAA